MGSLALVRQQHAHVDERLIWPRRLNAGTILKMVYGYTIDDTGDQFVRNADRALAVFAKASTPGWVVDIVPFRTSF